MNTWLRSKPSYQNSIKTSPINGYPYAVDEDAAFNAFLGHWQQVKEILKVSKTKGKVSSDDITAVLNHMHQMVNLLLVDVRRIVHDPRHNDEQSTQCTVHACGQLESHNGGVRCAKSHCTPMFDHFVGERVLQNVLQWSIAAGGEYFKDLQLELLKMYEILLSNSHPEILVYKPITEPLIHLLEVSSGCIPVEVEKRLMILLNQLWVSLMHNQHLLKFFFEAKEDKPPKFLIFSILLPFIHREGSVGQQARDTLLLSLSMSSSLPHIADYILVHSNFCPILAAGLSGLYSMLPRTLSVNTDGWYQISSEDVANTPSFQMILSSLEFCNAIVQSAHPAIQEQLIDYLYQGFLVPVVGPALIQMNVVDEIVAAIVYLDFFIQNVSEEKLRRAFLGLLLSSQEYSELPLLTAIISHLHSSNVQLNLVALNLFRSLIQLYSEDLMVSLVFQYLSPCKHVPFSQRFKLSKAPFHASKKFFEILPLVCQADYLAQANNTQDLGKSKSLPYRPLSDRHQRMSVSPSYSIYLKEAKKRVDVARQACSSWTWPYDAQNPRPSLAVRLVHAAKLVPIAPYSKLRQDSQSCSNSLPYERPIESSDLTKNRSLSLPSNISKEVSTHGLFLNKLGQQRGCTGSKVNCSFPYTITFGLPSEEEECRFDSLGESSGYESFINFKTSRDSSPLHNNNSKPSSSLQTQPALHSATDCVDSSDKEEGFAAGFLQFLEQSEASCTDQSESDLEFIDDLYNTFGDNNRNPRKSILDTVEESELESDIHSVSASLSNPSSDHDNHEEESVETSNTKATVGPFLEALINQISNLLTANMDVSLLAMTCVSALAAYPCTVLTSLLLSPSVTFQPSVKSLYQVLTQLKEQIDKVLDAQDVSLLLDAREKWYLSLASEVSKEEIPSVENNFVRGSNKRRSLSQAVTSFFKRSPHDKTSDSKGTLHDLPDGSGYRYVNSQNPARMDFSRSSFLSASAEKRQAIVGALLLQEWLLELAALAEEHTVSSDTLDFSFLANST